MEEKRKEIPLMEEQEFKDYLEENRTDVLDDLYKGIIHLFNYSAVSQFKSIRRAIKRGHVTPYGTLIPRRPFTNKANTCKRKGHHSRKMNELKKTIYERISRTTA